MSTIFKGGGGGPVRKLSDAEIAEYEARSRPVQTRPRASADLHDRLYDLNWPGAWTSKDQALFAAGIPRKGAAVTPRSAVVVRTRSAATPFARRVLFWRTVARALGVRQ